MTMASVNEIQEITRKGAKLTMLRKIPFVSKNKIRKEYNKFIDSLSQTTFNNRAIDLIRMLYFSKESCLRFKSSEEQADDTLIKYPRLKAHRELLIEWVRENRKDNGVDG